MILSIGIDIIEVYRIRESLDRTARFAERVFTEAERQYCDAKGKGSDQSYAGRFAAKEAFMKALRSGWRGDLAWQEVEVVVDELGAPSLAVKGEAKKQMQALGADRIHLSISHTREYAIAQVILEAS
ncbi:MAG TPA: holo-ACP synthase [Pyrinomonadaceae bacterium]|nr:holo-ACP synthase [Pyrinomonadaceae bacterium]